MPTGTVNVCLVDANGKALINSETLEAGQRDAALPRPPLPRHLRQRPGEDDGPASRTIDVPDRSTPVGYELRPGKRPRELSAARRPTCQ